MKSDTSFGDEYEYSLRDHPMALRMKNSFSWQVCLIRLESNVKSVLFLYFSCAINAVRRTHRFSSLIHSNITKVDDSHRHYSHT